MQFEANTLLILIDELFMKHYERLTLFQKDKANEAFTMNMATMTIAGFYLCDCFYSGDSTFANRSENPIKPDWNKRFRG